jgi:hypothetical protein
MTTYQISNSRSGAILGNHSGNTEAEALDAMAKDAGYRDYTHCQQVAPCDGLELNERRCDYFL